MATSRSGTRRLACPAEIIPRGICAVYFPAVPDTDMTMRSEKTRMEFVHYRESLKTPTRTDYQAFLTENYLLGLPFSCLMGLIPAARQKRKPHAVPPRKTVSRLSHCPSSRHPNRKSGQSPARYLASHCIIVQNRCAVMQPF
jgi:hypothetical protein